MEDWFHQKTDYVYLKRNIKEHIETSKEQIALFCAITHCGDSYECRNTGTVVAEAGHATVVGSGWKEAGDGHNVRGNSYRLLEVEKIKFILCHPYLFCL